MASTWSGTASNETISYNALSNLISNYSTYFIPTRCFSGLYTGTQQATKAIILDCVTCNPYAPVVASATTNQLVVKSEVVPFANEQSFVYDIADGGPYVNCNDAAALFYRGPYAPFFNTFYYDGTFQVGTTGRTAGNVASVQTTKYYNLYNGVGATSGKGVKFSLVEALYQIFQVAEICDYVAPSPTPTSTPPSTPTSTPPSTPASTPAVTPTQTQTPTPTNVAFGYVNVSNTGSLDVSITDVKVNGVSVTYDVGQNFPIDPSDSGQFITYQLGTYDIVVYYGTSISGQHIDVTDSNSNLTCENTGAPGSNTFTVTGAVINGATPVYVDALDGSC